MLPLHHSRENTLRLDKQQSIRLFPTLQLNLFDCIVLHSISPRSGHKWFGLGVNFLSCGFFHTPLNYGSVVPSPPTFKAHTLFDSLGILWKNVRRNGAILGTNSGQDSRLLPVCGSAIPGTLLRRLEASE